MIGFFGQNSSIVGVSEVIDQQQPTFERYTTSSPLLGQTFKAGITGHLTHIEVQDNAGETVDLRVKLNEQDGYLLHGPQSVVLSGGGAKTKIALSSPLPIVAGQTYYFELDGGAVTTTALGIYDTDGNSYPDGEMYNSSGSLTMDMVFATYVQPFSGINEPGEILSLRDHWDLMDKATLTFFSTTDYITQVQNKESALHLIGGGENEPQWEDQGRSDHPFGRYFNISSSYGYTDNEISIYAVIELTARNSAVFELFADANHYIRFVDDNANHIFEYRKQSLAAKSLSLSLIPLNTKVIAYFRLSDAIRVGGYEHSTTTESNDNSDYSGGSNSLSNIYVANSQSFLTNMDGYFYDLLVFDQYTSNTNHQQIIAYLKHKHSIA